MASVSQAFHHQVPSSYVCAIHLLYDCPLTSQYWMNRRLFVDCTIASPFFSCRTHRQYTHISSALTFYEHLITLGEEIRVIWCRKFTGATLLFLDTFSINNLREYVCLQSCRRNVQEEAEHQAFGSVALL